MASAHIINPYPGKHVYHYTHPQLRIRVRVAMQRTPKGLRVAALFFLVDGSLHFFTDCLSRPLPSGPVGIHSFRAARGIHTRVCMVYLWTVLQRVFHKVSALWWETLRSAYSEAVYPLSARGGSWASNLGTRDTPNRGE